ncbi:CbtA family protein [Natrinema halophilum]|uniref:CbtA family protein n=1 Tax=Natrinema halophilum TaxID=1699371 RepID=A0A7D5GS41_9EURY|nr:CbtA family protein [Natrinema halophilum]QLG48426.1 CbtA family protein [Natrinema halophilum]
MLVEYLERGILAGVIAGIAYGAYVAFVANPLISYMETVAEAGDSSRGHAHEAGNHASIVGEHAHTAGEEAHAVSEAMTATISVGGGVLWGILLGGIFALAYYVLEPALPGRGNVKACVLAGAGFLTVSGAPWLVLPPTTPGASQAYDPSLRVGIYLGMMVVGAVVATASVQVYQRVSTEHRLLGVVTAAAPIVALVASTTVGAPTIVEAGGMPAELVTVFRGLTALSQAALWTCIAGCFVWLQTRADVQSATKRSDDLLTNP